MDPSGGRQFIVNQDNPGVSFLIYFCNAVHCSNVDNHNSATLPSQIVAGTTNAYWADRSTGGFTYSYQSAMTTSLIPASYKPDLVAIDSSYIYFVDTGLSNIDRMPLAGGSVEVVVASTPSAVEGLTTDGTYVYYGMQGSVSFAPVAGGAAPVTLYAMAGVDFYGFTTAGGFVSWVGANFIVFGARTPL
jgi:hypothetical protein